MHLQEAEAWVVSLFGSWGRVQRALANMESELGTQASILDVRRHLVGATRKIGGRTTVRRTLTVSHRV
jgi:hypothetical protein